MQGILYIFDVIYSDAMKIELEIGIYLKIKSFNVFQNRIDYFYINNLRKKIFYDTYNIYNIK